MCITVIKMALDGMLLHLLAEELKNRWLGSRVEKIHQPSKNELVISLRGFGCAGKLLLSSSGSTPRIHLTKFSPENPQTPPMFCMLARKHLAGAKLADVKTLGLERIIMLEFEATNELMDKVNITLCVEIMSRHSNIIMINEDGIIIDCIKRVDESVSGIRLVLPGIKYSLPPAQDKLDLTAINSPESVIKRLKELKDIPLPKTLSQTLLGSSMTVCRELANGIDIENNESILLQRLTALQKILKSGCGTPVMLLSGQEPFDICFMDIEQYGSTAQVKKYPDFSSLLDDFYFERANLDRSKQRGTELIKLVKNFIERISKKMNYQKIELEKCKGREILKTYGELISANIYRLPNSSSHYEVENYYEPECPTVRINADPTLSPVQNSQRYFKEYKKACNAEIMITQQLKNGSDELEYLESVLDELTRAQSDKELDEIRDELKTQGYLRGKHSVAKKVKSLPAYRYRSSEGFLILVGRNNVQNDILTLKTASKNDIWLHTKDIHGSHTIIVTELRDVPEATLIEAAQLAAYHSSATASSNVPVDYTLVKYVKKPSGSKPGSVIYTNQKTVYVTPNRDITEMLRDKA